MLGEHGESWPPARGPVGRPEPLVHEAEPVNLEWPLAFQAGWLTPADRFYERNHFRRPEPGVSGWTLEVSGHVARPLSLGLRELQALPATSLFAVLECSGNKRSFFRPPAEGTPWRTGAVGNAQWAGVPLGLVLARAGVKPGAAWVRFAGADAGRHKEAGRWVHFERALPLEAARDPSVLLAFNMNGEPLPHKHGGPLRLVVPGWYGMASVKWLRHIEVRTEPFRGPFQVLDYVYLPAPGAYDRAVPVARVRVNSAIALPAEGARVSPGDLVVRGFAWSGAGPVRTVDVSLDGGVTWLPAQLAEPVARHAWSAWSAIIPAVRPGEYRVMARATDQAGNTQPPEAAWNAKGYGNNQISLSPITITQRPSKQS